MKEKKKIKVKKEEKEESEAKEMGKHAKQENMHRMVLIQDLHKKKTTAMTNQMFNTWSNISDASCAI